MRIPKRLIALSALALLIYIRRSRQMTDFSGQVALVSGGSRGLGLAIARELAGRGARLTLLARNAAELDEAAQSLTGPAPFEVICISADVGDEAQVKRAVQQTVDHYGRLDLLISDAGVIQVGPLQALTSADFEEAMRINFFGPLYLTLAARPHLQGTRGHIVNIASLGGLVPVPHLSSYGASKFALAGFSATSRAELSRDGIGVTTVHPTLLRSGSARHAQVRGKAVREYGWFAALDQAPLVSLDAAEAARRIVDAAARGVPELRLGGAAKLAALAYTLFPGVAQDLLGLGNRLLPAAGRDRQSGARSESAFTRHLPGKVAAETQFNER